MPRFAVLRHECHEGLHWDFLLETGSVLRTWSLPGPPQPGAEMTATALPDHRLLYLDYEGPISDDRGTVSRWDWGTFELVLSSDDQFVAELAGEKYAGRVMLGRMPGEEGRWRCRWE
jgi:hypothetical protein